MIATFRTYLLLFFLISSCSTSNTTKHSLEFETIIGKDNYNTMKLLTVEFEKNILKESYPTLSIEKAYEKFLIDIGKGKFDHWNKISSENRAQFQKSDLRLEIYEFPDSVWVMNNSKMDKIEQDSVAFLYSSSPYLKSRYKYKNLDGTFEYLYSRKSIDNLNLINRDSLIQNEYKIPRLNYAGKYLQALKTINNDNDFFNIFYDIKDTSGYISPDVMARILLNNKPDFSNDITKFLIVIEFGY